MTFWCGSGSADPCLWLMDPDPAIFVIDLQDANKKQIFYFIFSAYYCLKIHLHLFSKIKCRKESQNSRNQGFSYYFCMMIEGSRSWAGSGSMPLTNGSGSGSRRHKNMWIQCIRIRIRIRNTVWQFLSYRKASVLWRRGRADRSPLLPPGDEAGTGGPRHGPRGRGPWRGSPSPRRQPGEGQGRGPGTAGGEGSDYSVPGSTGECRTLVLRISVADLGSGAFLAPGSEIPEGGKN